MYGSSVTQVRGEYTPFWMITDDDETLDRWTGDECELDHDHGNDSAAPCDEYYKCDDCGENHEYPSDAESCCLKYECNFCGWEHTSSYWGMSAKDNARACCVTSCDDCGDEGNPDWMSEHNCDNGKGMRRALPWEQRGLKVDARDPDESRNWKQAWNLEPENHNVVRAAADYYLLEAMKAGLVGTVDAERTTIFSEEKMRDVELVHPNAKVANHTLVTILRNEAEAMFAALVDKWDPILIAYTHMAVGGELRHHNAVGGEVLNSDRNVAWSGWKLIFEAVGPDALTDAAELFHEFSGGSFGGKPWADACLILHKRLTGQIDRALFLDRIFNAQHNGGCLLNKVQWAGDKARYASNYGMSADSSNAMTVEEMTTRLLPAHGVEPEPDYSTLLAYASQEVRELFADFHEYGRRARLDMGMSLAGIPAKPSIGRTAWQQREYAQAQYQAKQAKLAAMPKSEKAKVNLRQALKQLKACAKYARNEVKQNARIDAKGADAHSEWCSSNCGPDDHKSTYYQEMLSYYQATVRTQKQEIAKYLAQEAEAALNPPMPTLKKGYCQCCSDACFNCGNEWAGCTCDYDRPDFDDDF